MGRPLNKKYFGNRNIGSTGTGDNYGIGGEGLAAYTLAAQKGVVAINNTYKYFPTLTIPSPDLPSGVPATATVVWEVNTVSLAGGTTYTSGTITSITGLDSYASTPTRFTVSVAGGVPSFNAFTDRGEYTSIDGTAITTWAVIGPGGDGAAQATVTFRLKSITTVEKGSGYTSAPTLSWARASSQTAGGQTQTGTPTVALTTDSGNVGSSTNQENAITITAWVPASGAAGNISGNGTSAVTGDIVRQVGSKKYVVKTAQGVGRVTLVAGVIAAGQANIIATDANGNTYYVTKLTAHKATLTRLVDDGGDLDWVFATGAVAQWSFNAASGTIVQIANS